MRLRDFVSCFILCVLIINCYHVIRIPLWVDGDLQTDCVNVTCLVVKVKPQSVEPQSVEPQSVEPQSVKPSVELTTYELVLMITSDKEEMTKEVKDCIFMLSLYQRSFSCKGIVFSDSNTVKDFASQSDVMTMSNIVRNKYGLPIISSLFQRARSAVNGSFYGYINSDVVLNPRVFSLLPTITKLIDQGKLSPRLELASRIYKINPFLQPGHFTNITTFSKVIDSLPRRRLHHIKSADVFIFTRAFPFEKIPPVVVGRARVDNTLLELPSRVNGMLVDLTFYARNFHQGLDGFRNHGYTKQSVRDKKYNYKYSSGQGSLMNNGKYFFDSKGRLKVIDRNKYKKMKCSFVL